MGLRNRAGNPIALSRLAELLKNKIYLGKVVWHGVEYDGIHEPLVTRELFDPVHASIMCPAAAHVQSPRVSFPYIGQSGTLAVKSSSAGAAGSFVVST